MEISPEKLAASGVAGAILIVLLTPALRWKVTHFVGVLLGKYVHKTHRVCKSGEPPIEYGDAESGVNDELWDNPWGYLKKCRAKYGDIFTLRIANNSTSRGYDYQTFIMDPDVAYSTALGGRNVDKEPTSRQALQRFGCSNLLSTRKGVFSLGRHLRHACNHAAYDELFVTIQESVSKLGFPSLEGQSWPPSDSHNAAEIKGKGEFIRTTERLAFRVMVESMYGAGSVSDELEDAFLTIHHKDPVLQRMRIAGQELEWQPDPELAAADEVLKSALSDEAQVERGGSVSPIILHMDAIAEEFDLPRVEAYQLKKGMMWAALLNVQQVCVWTFLNVFNNDEVLNALRAELASVRKANGSEPNDPFSRSEVANMPILEMILWETLRVYSRSNLIRVATTDHEISARHSKSGASSPYKIRKGDWVASFPREFHHSEDIFGENAGCWNPLGRKSKSAKVRNKIVTNAMYAFGVGNGQCPAYKFGVDAVKIMLIHLTENYDITFDQGTLPPQEISGVHAIPCPTGKIPFRFSKRLQTENRSFSGAAKFVVAAIRWKGPKTKVSKMKKMSVISCPDHYEGVVAEEDYPAMQKNGLLIDPEGDIYHVMLKLPHDCLRRYLKKMTNYKVEPTTEAILNVATWYRDFHALVSSHISLSKNALYFPWLKNIEVPKSETLLENHAILVSGMSKLLELTSKSPPEKASDLADYANALESQIKCLARKMMQHLQLEEQELPAARRSVAGQRPEMSFESVLRGCVDYLVSSEGLERSELFLALLVSQFESGQWNVSPGIDALIAKLEETLPSGYRARTTQKLRMVEAASA